MPRVPSPTQCVCPRVSHTVCPSHMFGQMGPGLGGKMHNLTENIKWGGNLRTETREEVLNLKIQKHKKSASGFGFAISPTKSSLS